MSKLILMLICVASFAFADTGVPELHESGGLPELSNKPEKPLENDLPELSDSPDRNEEKREELVSVYSLAPQQETILLPQIRLSTSDMPDSNDMICILEPPHLLPVRAKD